MEYEILLGCEELNKNKFIIDFEQGIIKINGEVNFTLLIDETQTKKGNNFISNVNLKEGICNVNGIAEIYDNIDNNDNNIYYKNDYIYDDELNRMDRLKEDRYLEGRLSDNGDRPKDAAQGVELKANDIDCDKEWKDKVFKLICEYICLVNDEARVAENYVHEIEVKNMGEFKPGTKMEKTHTKHIVFKKGTWF